jgi:hypothetical protein
MWTMLLIAGSILHVATCEGLPQEAKGCTTFWEWWRKCGESYRWEDGTVDRNVLDLCRYFMKRNVDDVVSTLAAARQWDCFDDRDGQYRPGASFRKRRHRVTFQQIYANHIFAARILGALGPSARAGAPLLKEMLEESDTRIQVLAAAALWNVEKNPDSVNFLMLVLHRTTPAELSLAPPQRTEKEIPESNSDGAPILGAPYWEHPLPLMWGETEQRPHYRQELVTCSLTKCFLANRHGIWFLSPQPVVWQETRLMAVKALGDIGSPASAAARMLSNLMDDADHETAFAAACALWKINQSPEAVSRIRLMSHENPMLYFKVQVMMPELVRDFERKQQEQIRGVQNPGRMERF